MCDRPVVGYVAPDMDDDEAATGMDDDKHGKRGDPDGTRSARREETALNEGLSLHEEPEERLAMLGLAEAQELLRLLLAAAPGDKALSSEAKRIAKEIAVRVPSEN